MDMFMKLVVVAVLVESLTEIIKSLFEGGSLNKSVFISIILGLILSSTVNLDLLRVVGLDPIIPYVGILASGFIVSRGANAVHDLIGRVRGGE